MEQYIGSVTVSRKKVFSLFYYTYAHSVVTYGLINYGSTYKANLEHIDETQRRILRALFYRRQWDTLQDVYTIQIFQCLRNVHRRSSEKTFQIIKTQVTQYLP